jgi:ribonuclease PH
VHWWQILRRDNDICVAIVSAIVAMVVVVVAVCCGLEEEYLWIASTW